MAEQFNQTLLKTLFCERLTRLLKKTRPHSTVYNLKKKTKKN